MKCIYVVLIFVLWVCVWPGCSDHGASPVINDFESDSDLDRIIWKCHTLYALSSDHVTHGQKGLKMSLYPSDYPGVSFKGYMKDWKPYARLSMDVYNPESQGNISVTVRIDDKEDTPPYQDRVNIRIILKPGMNHVNLPMNELVTPSGRHLDVSHIYAFMMFMVKPTQEKVLFVDHVRLEKK